MTAPISITAINVTDRLALTSDDRTVEITNLYDDDGEETDDEDTAVTAVVCVNEHCWVVIELDDYATVVSN